MKKNKFKAGDIVKLVESFPKRLRKNLYIVLYNLEELYFIENKYIRGHQHEKNLELIISEPTELELLLLDLQ